MRKLALVLPLAASIGCVSAPPRRFSLDVSQVPNGLYCYPVEPAIRSEVCPWQLGRGLSDLLDETLDDALDKNAAGYRARFELLDLRFETPAFNRHAIIATEVTYRFVLRDAKCELVHLEEKIVQPTAGRHRPGQAYFSLLNSFLFETFAPIIERIRVALAASKRCA
jgi:hypothetical protein